MSSWFYAPAFSRASNSVTRGTLAGSVGALGFAAWVAHAWVWSPYVTHVRQPVTQPVPFSHEHHVAGLGIDCRYCHTGVETSSFAGIPPTETCMTCHSQVWRDAPVLAPVRQSWAENRPLHWQRVHDLPDYVYFDHSIHVAKGVACVSCHGAVAEMPLMWKTQTLYMRWCLDCHRHPENHVRSPDEVFSSSPDRGVATPESVALVRSLQLKKDRLEDCSICHR